LESDLKGLQEDTLDLFKLPMRKQSTRLDRFISKQKSIPTKDVRIVLAQQRILVDDLPANSIHQVIHHFSKVTLDGEVLQNHQPHYLLLNKPKGVVSATKDLKHKTVIDLIDQSYKDTL
jgi:16S rRNA pseudouridine516 synthase